MEKTFALLACLTLLSVCPAAAQAPASEPAPAAPADVITPLNVRDPSALVMGPGAMGPGSQAKLPMVPPGQPAAPEAGSKEAKPDKTAVDKTGARPGERAVAVSMDDDQLLGVKPGDRVDLISVFDMINAQGAREKTAATILQNVRVLGVVTTKDLHAKGVLTLELNPVEAQYALLGQRQAELGLAVRAPGDVELHPMEMTSFRSLFR